MPTATSRAAIPYPLETDYNDIPVAMHDLAQRVDDVFALSYQGLISARPTTVPQREFYWASDDRGGKLYYGDGAQWWEMGPAPWSGPNPGSQTAILQAPGIMGTADPVAQIRGKSGQTGDLTRWQDPTGTTTLAAVRSDGGIMSAAAVTAQSAAITNGITAASATLSGALSAGSATVSGAATITGALSAGSMSLGTPLPVGSGGTGSATQNFVDLSNTQTVNGLKSFNSPVRAADGTATAPTLSFQNDTTMGIYRVAAGVLGLAVPASGWISGRRPDGSEFFKVQQSGAITAYGQASVPSMALQSNGGTIDTSGTQVRFYSGTAGVSSWISFPGGIVLNTKASSMAAHDVYGTLSAGDTAGFQWGANAAFRARHGTQPAANVPVTWLESAAGMSGDAAYQLGLRNYANNAFQWNVGQVGSDGHLSIATNSGGGPSELLIMSSTGVLSNPVASKGFAIGNGLYGFGTTNPTDLFQIYNGSGQRTMNHGGDGNTSFYNGGVEKIRLESNLSRVSSFGNQNGMAGFDAAGNPRFLMGLRSDLTGNNSDVVLYAYGGGKLFFMPGTTLQWFMDTSGNLVSTGTTGSGPTFTGNGVLAMRNAAANPFTTPVAGGVIYVSAGALRYRGPSGTDTQLAAA